MKSYHESSPFQGSVSFPFCSITIGATPLGHRTVAWLKKSHPDSFPSPAMALSRGYRQPGNRWMWMSSRPPGNITAKKKKPSTNHPFWGGSMLVDGRVETQMAGVFGDFPQPIFTLKATCQDLGVVLNSFFDFVISEKIQRIGPFVIVLQAAEVSSCCSRLICFLC